MMLNKVEHEQFPTARNGIENADSDKELAFGCVEDICRHSTNRSGVKQTLFSFDGPTTVW